MINMPTWQEIAQEKHKNKKPKENKMETTSERWEREWKEAQTKAKRETKPTFNVGTEVKIYTTGVIDRIAWDSSKKRWMYDIDLFYGSATVDASIIEDVNCMKEVSDGKS